MVRLFVIASRTYEAESASCYCLLNLQRTPSIERREIIKINWRCFFAIQSWFYLWLRKVTRRGEERREMNKMQLSAWSTQLSRIACAFNHSNVIVHSFLRSFVQQVNCYIRNCDAERQYSAHFKQQQQPQQHNESPSTTPATQQSRNLCCYCNSIVTFLFFA